MEHKAFPGLGQCTQIKADECAGMSSVEVHNEGLRSSLSRDAFRRLLALGKQLAPAPPAAADTHSAAEATPARQAGVRFPSEVWEDAC